MADDDRDPDKDNYIGQKVIFAGLILVVALQSYIILNDKAQPKKPSQGLSPVVVAGPLNQQVTTPQAARNSPAANDTVDMPVSFRVAGRVTQMFFPEHAHVKQGDILATLDTAILEDVLAGARMQLQTAIANDHNTGHAPNPNFPAIEVARTKLDAAQHTYDNAHAEMLKRGSTLLSMADKDNVYLDDVQNDHDAQMALERAQRELVQQENIGRENMGLDEKQAAIQIAQNNVTSAEKNLAAAQLVAPADGIVATRNIEAGTTVAQGTTVYVLSVSKKALPDL